MKSMALSLIVMMAISTFSMTDAYADMDVKTAKLSGYIGEQPDGLLGIVDATADVTVLVAKTNTARLDKYKSIAVKNGTSLEKVKALAGKELIKKSPSGTYIKTAAGEWRQKP